MKDILLKLTNHLTLTRDEACTILKGVATGEYNASQVSAFLTVYMMRLITVEELMGFRDALLELCIQTDLSEFNTIDMCGTGGDGKNTFNISTLASFVVAGTGEKVAKHGNYGVSSASGSSNMLEYFGYSFSNDRDKLARELDTAGFCFMHAPMFHPAMKNVGPIRKELGLKTFFNILGPLVNPSFPQNQLMGVFSLETARLYHYIFQQTNRRYSIIYSLDGYDEISLTGSFKIITNEGEQLLEPKDFGFNKLMQEDIFGGNNVEEAADIFSRIIQGHGSAEQNQVVIANAAQGLKTIHPDFSLAYCLASAEESLVSGKAHLVFRKLMEMN
ncbi:MAG: anthranilate phosphoribosyltransferase [Bacteroidales bacterium]|nr:anthranilate phosphoribosyltransferase [Bacteroidales bacterium]